MGVAGSLEFSVGVYLEGWMSGEGVVLGGWWELGGNQARSETERVLLPSSSVLCVDAGDI